MKQNNELQTLEYFENVRTHRTGQGQAANFGEFLQRVSRNDPSLLRAAATGLGEDVPSDGGFLVHEDLASELLTRVYQTGQLASRVQRMSISRLSSVLRLNALDEDSRADGSRWGGARTYWKTEGAQVTASYLKFREMRFSPHALMSIAQATDDLLSDATALAAFVSKTFGNEILFQLENGIVNGSGVGEPLGILNSEALIEVAKDSGDVGATISTTDVLNMYSSCWPPSRKNAVWLVNPDAETQLYPLKLGSATGGRFLYFADSGEGFGRLMGRPVLPCEYCATLGTPGDILLADLTQYVICDKGAPNQDSSIHVAFLTGESVYRSVYRVDGQPSWKKPLTPKNGTQTSSPFVALAARA